MSGNDLFKRSRRGVHQGAIQINAIQRKRRAKSMNVEKISPYEPEEKKTNSLTGISSEFKYIDESNVDAANFGDHYPAMNNDGAMEEGYGVPPPEEEKQTAKSDEDDENIDSNFIQQTEYSQNDILYNSDDDSHYDEKDKDNIQEGDDDYDIQEGDDDDESYRYWEEQDEYLEHPDFEKAQFLDDSLHSFNFGQQLDELLDQYGHSHLPADDASPVCNDSTTTKGEFARGLEKVFIENKTDAAGRKNMVLFLQKQFPGYNFPIDSNGNFSLEPYCKEKYDGRMLEFHMCPNSCCAFVGDYSNSIRCQNCNAQRYKACKFCKNIEGSNYDNCPHRTTRVPEKIAFYRPFTLTLRTLLDTPGFLPALRWRLVRDNQSDYMDVSDGDNYTYHMNAMHERYLEAMNQRKVEKAESCEEISLCLSLFYDGMKVSNKGDKHFSPLQLTILNLPPTFRSTVSVGMHALTVFTQSSGSAAETFLLVKLLCGELEYLSEGKVWEINKKWYYVQVRLICTTMDTPALTSFFGMCSHTKAEWCPLCVSIKGKQNNALNCRTWAGHRAFTAVNNPLRLVGNTQTSCNCNNDLSSQERCRMLNLDICETCPTHQPDHNTLNALKPLLNKTMSGRVGNYYAHGKELWDSISEKLQFEHCCLEPQATDVRRETKEWKRDADQAVNDKKAVRGIERKAIILYLLFYSRANKDFNFDNFHALMGTLINLINEVKGGMRDRLEGIRRFCQAANIHYPYFHQQQQSMPIKKVSTSPGKRGKDVVSKNKSEILSKIIPWVASKQFQHMVDADVCTLMIPSGYKDTFQLTNPFQKTGEIRGHDVIKFFTVLMDYVNLDLVNKDNDKGGIHSAYGDFFHMIGKDIAALLADEFTKEQIVDLDIRMKESIATLEGLFSPHLATYLMHEVIHLAKYIEIMGPLRHWSTYAGERSHTFWKPFIPKGGRSPDITVMHKANKLDITRTQNAYNFSVSDYMPSTQEDLSNINRKSELEKRLQASMFDPRCMEINECGEIIYNPHKFYLYNTEKGHRKHQRELSFTKYEHDQLITAMVFEVVKQCGTRSVAVQRSPLFRLYCAFEHHSKRRETYLPTRVSFRQWLCIWDAYKEPPGENRRDLRRLYTYCLGYDQSQSNDIESFVKKGFVYKTDIAFAGEILKMKIFPFYQKATIFGVHFSSRGAECREREPPTREIIHDINGNEIEVYRVKRSGNKLHKEYHKTSQYSSFCFFHVPTGNFKKPFGEELCGQFNFFFRLKLPSDPVLHGVPMASILARTFQIVDRVPTLQATVTHEDHNDFSVTNHINHPTFIPLTNVKATAILVGAKNANNERICIEESLQKLTKDNKKYCCEDTEDVFKLLLPPLHSSKKNITFSTLSDTNNYKRFEDE